MRWPSCIAIVFAMVQFVPLAAFGQPEQSLDVFPGTARLDIQEPLDEVMVAGIHRFALRELNASRSARDARWTRDYSSAEAYEKSVESNRSRFRTIIGAVDRREEPEGFEIIATLGQDGAVASSADVTVYAVRWPVLPGVTGEGLLLEPRRSPIARVVALPDADWTPDKFVGLSPGLDQRQLAPRRLATAGIQVVVPTLISRDDTYSGSPQAAYTNQPHREFIYRQAFTMGRHPIGYEIEKVEAAVDQLERLNQEQAIDLPIGVMGVGEGGLLALYAAAVDRRIDAALVSGYFQKRESVWKEPIYRNVWALLTEFGDAEIASLIAPRALVVEACSGPEVNGPPPVRDGRRGGAAPGEIETCSVDSVRNEFERAKAHYQGLGVVDRVSFVASDDGSGPSGSAQALSAFAASLGVQRDFTARETVIAELKRTGADIDSADRQRRQVSELTEYTQRLLTLSPKVRDEFWSKADRSKVQTWESSAQLFRDHVWEEMIGKLPAPTIPPNVRTRRVLDDPAYTGYEVAIDVYPDVIAAGILLLPKDLAPQEKRPVIVCQHGLEGVPMDTITRRDDAHRYYKSFAAELAKRGFIVYSPQNPYRGAGQFRVLQRLSNPMKRSLFSYIIVQYERTLDWLSTLPNVDAKRIGFYGLSYGGKTAMRVPTILHDRFAVCVCSGDFNEWIRKMVSTTDSYSYVFTGEYEMPEWNMGHVAGYAELASLISPRPFMVERGHQDGVAPDEWVAWEFAKVRRHYAALGIEDRCEIEFFNGPHTIHGVRTYAFLEKHLEWNGHATNNTSKAALIKRAE
jgi:dienelactone hydrolase